MSKKYLLYGEVLPDTFSQRYKREKVQEVCVPAAAVHQRKEEKVGFIENTAMRHRESFEKHARKNKSINFSREQVT